jgi:trehalose utilization protein
MIYLAVLVLVGMGLFSSALAWLRGNGAALRLSGGHAAPHCVCVYRRASIDTVTRQVLHALEQDLRIELAYPTYRIFRLGDEVPRRIGAAAMHPEA